MAKVDTLFDVYVFLRTAGDDLIIKGQAYAEMEETAGVLTIFLRDFVSYPDSRAYKIIFRYLKPIVEIDYEAVIYLTSSRAYNYSFWTKKEEVILLEQFTPIMPENRSYRETNVIIASENSVPFYFPVETSYKVGGNITDISLMVEQITDSQIGQYPLVVLTDRGIFALEQGAGGILYARLIPIANDICAPGSVQTPRGVAYIANRAVNILVGRNSVNISAILEGPIDDNIRENASFILATSSDDLYNVSDYLSVADFREYLINAILLYDTNRNEIIVSNSTYNYSYVFNLPSQTWHKITYTYRAGKGRLALQMNGSKVHLVDITNEITEASSCVVHAQTRPIKAGSEGYKTIYRAILRGELFPIEPFGAYIYGSNDLMEWKLISVAQTEEDTANLRLFRAKYSFRYFIVAAGGIVNTISNVAYMDLEIDDKYQSKTR